MHAAHLEAFPCIVSRCETEPLYALSQFHRRFLTCIFLCIIDVLAREDAYLYWLHFLQRGLLLFQTKRDTYYDV